MMRIGHGMDIHPFVSGRPLILGGVQIPHAKGLQGHSDADALSHAICDALLGALALGDIGTHFPDTDPTYKGKSSMFFVEHVTNLIRDRGWEIANVDATIVTEEPMLRPYVKGMQETLGRTMKLVSDQVSIKSTRPEKLGSLGNKEGLLATATVLLMR